MASLNHSPFRSVEDGANESEDPDDGFFPARRFLDKVISPIAWSKLHLRIALKV